MSDVSSLVAFDENGVVELLDDNLLASVSAGWSISANYRRQSNNTCGSGINNECGNPNASCVVGVNNACGLNDYCTGVGGPGELI